MNNVLNRAVAASIVLSDQERAEVANWLNGAPPRPEGCAA